MKTVRRLLYREVLAAVGFVTLAFESQRAGMATILPFFAIGLFLLWRKVP